MPKKTNRVSWDPELNPNIISIVKQEDGNYIGYMQKHGRLVTARQGDPNTVLVMLITHE